MTRGKAFWLGRLFLLTAVLASTVPARVIAEEPDLAAHKTAANQVSKIVLAFQFYHSEKKSFPLPAIMSNDGQPLLSWRVAVLPYMEEQMLYDQFALDEAWDSPHNKPLVAKMPAIFLCPNSQKGKRGMTVYQVPRGAATAFPGKEAVSIRKITDGTADTIAIVEVDEDHAVPWTKPEDWEFVPDNPVKGLGGHLGDVIVTGFCDGRVVPIRKSIKPETLRALFTRAGRESVTAE